MNRMIRIDIFDNLKRLQSIAVASGWRKQEWYSFPFFRFGSVDKVKKIKKIEETSYEKTKKKISLILEIEMLSYVDDVFNANQKYE